MDSTSDQTPEVEAAQALLSALAGAPAKLIADAWDRWTESPAYRVVRGPETGLVMIRGRTGGGGAPFNLGEATVTRSAIRLETGEIGHSYALGRDHEKSIRAAVFHALWQRDPAAVETEVLGPIRAAAATADTKRRRETAATKVDFFTMVRGDD